MKILFYNTNSNKFDFNTFKIFSYPNCKMEFDKLSKDFSEHEFIVVSEFPGMFLLDLQNDGTVKKSSNVKYYIFNSEKKNSVEEFCDVILNFNPDVAIPLSFWVTPFDWLGIKDSLVAQILNQNGIKTFCNPVQTSHICFDKNITCQKIQEIISNENIHICLPKTIYVHHQLFWAERNHQEVKENVYKEMIFHEIKKLNFPVVIKDTVGVSSYGMEVASSYNQLVAFLNSKRNNSDRIIQEYIDGLHFGTEIYSTEKNHLVLSPFIFSTNRYGITSPKQSVKLGPINNEEYKIIELKESLKVLADKLKLRGITQIDLVLKNDKWYLIEINPRVSGMSKIYSSCFDKSLIEIFLNLFENKIDDFFSNKNFAINFKIPILSEENFEKISKNRSVKYINQLHNLNAKQEREKGFCEVVLFSKKDLNDLQKVFFDFIKNNKNIIDEELIKGSFELFEKIKTD